jgi:hypothetical protein
MVRWHWRNQRSPRRFDRRPPKLGIQPSQSGRPQSEAEEQTAIAAHRPTPEHLRQAYLRTQVWIVIDDDLFAADEAVEVLPAPIFVITASNPFSKQRSDHENARANAELAAELEILGGDIYEAIGESPDGTWAEVSFAITGAGRRRMISLGRRFGQEAIFELTRDELVVRGCATNWRRARPWQTAQVASAAKPGGVDLFSAVEESLKTSVTADFTRASFTGWEYEGDTGIHCCECGSTLHLFGNSLRSAKGEPYSAMAIVCPSEGVARLPADHVEQLDALKLYRHFALAQRDADGRPDPEHLYSVYVIELADTVGPGAGALPWVYVGQTSATPEERFAQHLAGYKASRWVQHHGVRLRPDLTCAIPPLRTQAESEAFEAYLAERLRLEGYPVKGGH